MGSKYVQIKHCVSRLFQPKNVVPKTANIKKQDVTSKSQRLLQDLGIIHQSNTGCYHFLPLGIKSLEKLTNIIDEQMSAVDGQKVSMPTLINTKLWKTSGRLSNTPELFQLNDRHNQEYILCPTHEETAADLLASIQLSYKSLPLRLYQITNKFRDEMKPRFGLIRCREFLMKDLYSFDADVTSAKQTYEIICESYDRIFEKIGVHYKKVLGNSGIMGGSLSHEYHYQCSIGEDKLLSCNNCNYSVNAQLMDEATCPECEKGEMEISTGIEVGHTFFLGDKYSKPLQSTYLSHDAKPIVFQMGSYGLGITRILAAALEVLSCEQELRWPDSIAPYNVIIIPPKLGSKEELLVENTAENLYTKIESISNLRNNVLLDDRINLTIGKRYVDAKRLGIRFIIVLGKKFLENPSLYEITDLKNNSQFYLSEDQLLDFIKTNFIAK